MGLLGDFIILYPEFQFDLEEYLYSTKYIISLSEKFIAFQNSFEDRNRIIKKKQQIVAALRNYIAKNVSAYTALYNIKDFDSIPFIDKNSVSRNPDTFINRQFNVKELWHKKTSGTTGPPITISYSPSFYFEHLLLTVQKIAARAKVVNSKCSNVFCLSITDNLSMKDWVVINPNRQTGLMLQVVIDESKPETIERLFSLFNSLKPAIITGKPSLFEVLIAQTPQQWSLSSYSPDCIITSGALLDETLRRQVQDLFGSKVYNTYALVEFGPVASECPNQDGLHIDENSMLVELVDDDRNLIKDSNKGELTLSSIDNMAMPLIRYRTGDIAAVDSTNCSCGASGARLKNLSGRKITCFRFESGSLFSPVHFNQLFTLFPISEFQITQLDFKHFEVLIQPKRVSGNIDLMLKRIRRYIQNAFPCQVNISLKIINFDYRSKFERYRTFV